MATARTATRTKTTRGKGNRKRRPVSPPRAQAPQAKKKRAVRRSKAKKKAPKKNKPSFFEGRGAEVTGVVTLGLSIFFMISLFSIQFGEGVIMGPFGRSFALLGYSLFGIGSYFVAAVSAIISVRVLVEKETVVKGNHVIGITLGLLSFGVLAHLIGSSYRISGFAPGGMLGENLAKTSRALVSTAGTALVATVLFLVSIVIATPLRMRTLLVLFGGAGRSVGQGAFSSARKVGQDAAKFSGEVIRAVLPERDHDEYLDDEYDDEPYDDELELEEKNAELDPPIIDVRSGPVAVPEGEIEGDTEKVEDAHMLAIANGLELPASTTKGKSKPSKKNREKKTTMTGVGEISLPADNSEKPAKVEKVAKVEAVAQAEDVKKELPTRKEMAASLKKEKEATKAAEEEARSKEPQIVESEFKMGTNKEMAKKEAEAEEGRLDFIKLKEVAYQLPSLDYLAFDESREEAMDKGAMLELSAKLVQTLENYGVKGHVAAIRPGPVVTMYEFAPAPGTRLNKIVNLSDDLAMSLEAMKVRIVAPIPGKAAVGIEVPNKKSEMVYLKEIIADEGFMDKGLKLPMSLGKSIEGAPVSIDLAKMPHLLVAGTTGSGKSVSVNSMITSLLYACTPEEVRMIMIDPKMLELSIYEGIPHLLLPVVTDPKKANLALRWAVDEMERRYGLLAGMGVRDIRTYNTKIKKQQAQWEADRLQRKADEAKRLANDDSNSNDTTDEPGQRVLDFEAPEKEPSNTLPFIVVVIDEFADLMMCAPKEVETSVARIAQKARAAGIHLILATQRPSVDVITGLIKANFPSRMAFRVSSKIDSRTILDQSGAENLLGYGDMLFSDRGAPPVRLHGCYVDEDEISKVVEFLKTQGKPSYNLDIIKPREDEDESGDGSSGEKGAGDALYDQAVQIVAESQRVSVSYLQRRLSVGYNRSAKMVERMEQEGVVSVPDNKKQRQVLIGAG